MDIPPGLIHPSLLDEDAMLLMAGFRDEAIFAGAIANRSATVAGLTNVFSAVGDLDAAWRGSVASVAEHMGVLPLVGYERGGDLEAAGDTDSHFLVLCGYGSRLNARASRAATVFAHTLTSRRSQKPALTLVFRPARGPRMPDNHGRALVSHAEKLRSSLARWRDGLLGLAAQPLVLRCRFCPGDGSLTKRQQSPWTSLRTPARQTSVGGLRAGHESSSRRAVGYRTHSRSSRALPHCLLYW
jgi:hypothetical protein